MLRGVAFLISLLLGGSVCTLSAQSSRKIKSLQNQKKEIQQSLNR